MKIKYVPSRYNVLAKGDDGELLLSNIFSGAFGVVPDKDVSAVRNALKKSGIEIEEQSGIGQVRNCV